MSTNQTSERRARLSLPADNQILISRAFDAPVALVYRAWTTPELIKRWWTANRGEAVSVEVDLRVGGRWRYLMTAHHGAQVAFHGQYRAVVTNELLVYTEVYEAIPGSEALNTVSFSEHEGRTTVTVLSEHADQANRDQHLNVGMQDGLQDALDLLEALAISLRD